MGRLAPGTAAFIVLSTTHPAPVPAAELEGEDGFTARSTATTQPAAGAAVTDTDAASGTRDAESTAATGELASTGSRTAGRAELAVNAQLADQVFSLDAVGPVTSTVSQLSRVVAVADAGESTLLASFGGLNPSGGAINTDVAQDCFLPPTPLEISDKVERVVLGPAPGGQPVVVDAVGAPLMARVSARLHATAARLFSLDNQHVSCNLHVECPALLEYEATLTRHVGSDGASALTVAASTGPGMSEAGRRQLTDGIRVTDVADTAGFERRLSVELPSLAGSFAWRNLRTDFELYYELSAEVSGLGFGSSAVAAINDPLRF